MKQLHKHELDFDPAREYVQNSLDKANTLSSELLNLLNFKNGIFFTLLPNDANIERLYEFKAGGILPQNPIQEYVVAGEKATYSIIPTIGDEVSELILKEIKSKEKLCCVFDDVLRSPADKHHMDLFHAHGLSYDNEVYYLLDKGNISSELIMQCLRASNAFWHSLCVLTEATISGIRDKRLSLEKVKEICLGTKLMMVGAYDAEGYVFWEKSESLTSFPNVSPR